MRICNSLCVGLQILKTDNFRITYPKEQGAEIRKTAIDQINLYLVEQAKNLLLNPNTTISETAYKLGFEYPQYFSQLFKKKTGISPKEYVETALLS